MSGGWFHILMGASDCDQTPPSHGDVAMWDDTLKLWVPQPANVVTYIYFGSPLTDGSWRFARVGNDLVAQRRESGTWVDKGSFQP